MRWNCPHCHVALAISDEQLGTNYSFSRCYKCQGYALIRRSDSQPIKVDQPPVPRDHEAVLEQAINHLARARAHRLPAQRPVVRPGNRRSQSTRTTVLPPKFNPPRKTPEPNADVAAMPVPPVDSLLTVPRTKSWNPPAVPKMPSAPPRFPDPLPEVPTKKSSHRIFKVAMTLAGVCAVGSGVYLFMQAQALWNRAHTTTAITQKAAAPVRQVAAAATVSDQVHANAMAPIRAPELARANIPISAAPAAAPITITPAQVKPAPDLAPLLVETRAKNASLRTGPGLQYQILGYAKPDIKYIVSEWNDHWFKIIVNDGREKRTAWIRNDLVRLVSLN